MVRRGEFTLGPVDLQIDWADRVAITGANGAGKSTLLAALLGRVEPDEGHASLGPGVRVGEVDQARALFAGDGRPACSAPSRRSCRTGPRPTCAPCWPSSASPPRTSCARPRASPPANAPAPALALLQARGVNLLVLDEPTNHLDLPAIEQLESALAGYPGTLLLVTHDRRMLDAVHTNRHLHVSDGTVTDG